MTTEVLDIIVRETGATAASRNIERVGTSARTTGSSVGFLQKALTALGAVLAVRSLTKYIDSLQSLQNKLKLVTTSTSELVRIQKALFDISNSTRTSISSTGTFYARLSAATEDLNLSESQLLTVTKALQQSFIISGSTASEAANAAIQLSQGLASGRFQGDELRSVLEANTRFGALLAKQFGVTRGALRDLGAEGKITARIVVDALTGAATQLDTEMAKLTPTIEQGLTVLDNQFTLVIGQFNAATGASGLLGTAFQKLGGSFPQILANALAVGNTLRASFENLVRVVTGDATPAMRELAAFFPFLGESAGSAFEFIRGALFQLPDNIRAVIRIMIAELDVFAQSVNEKILGTLALSFEKLGGFAEKLGLDSVAAFFNDVGRSFGQVAEEANQTKNLRRQTADDFIAQTLRERQASQVQFQERLKQLAALQAASIKAAALPALPGATINPAGSFNPGGTGAAGGLGGSTPGGLLGPNVGVRDIRSANINSSDGNTFGQPFGAPPVQGGTPVSINFSNGDQTTVFTDRSTAARLRLGFEGEARKAGSY